MSTKLKLPFEPWLSSDGCRLLPFEVRLQGTEEPVTICSDRIAYITPGAERTLTTWVHFAGGDPGIEIICPYAALSVLLQEGRCIS